MRRDASPLRDRPDWTSHRPVPRFVDDDACSGAPPAAEGDTNGAQEELPARRVGIQFRDIAIDAISWRGGEPRRLVRGLHGAVAPATLTRRVGKLSVTCEALPATRENWPPRMANKKAEKMKKHGPKDPARSRPAPR